MKENRIKKDKIFSTLRPFSFCLHRTVTISHVVIAEYFDARLSHPHQNNQNSRGNSLLKSFKRYA